MASAPADGEGAVAEEDEMSATTIDGDDSVERAVFASPSQAKVEAQSARPWSGKIRSLWWVLAAGLTAAVVLVGALAASFLMRPPQVVEAPLLLVDQVEPLTNDEPTRILARTPSESLISALQQFDGLAISPKPTDDRVIAKLLARYPSRSVYLLASELRIDRGTVRLWWRLSDQRTMEIHWTSTQEGPWDPNAGSTEEEIAKQVATTIAYWNGLVKSFEARALPNPPPPGYLCLLWAQRYSLSLDAKTHAATRDCLEKTVARSPNNADAWAYLAIIYADEARNGYNLETARAGACKGEGSHGDGAAARAVRRIKLRGGDDRRFSSGRSQRL
jgi:TolB-like protein